MKKILVLGGKPIGSVELVRAIKKRGCYVIVSDYLPAEKSPAKQIADEIWDISTADIELLEVRCRDNQIDGILTAVHEFNINRMLDLCERLNLPCYCKRSTWIYCDSKVEFKKLCLSNNIPVAQKYEICSLSDTELAHIVFPVVTKPVDGSGSRGFSICKNVDELRKGYNYAKQFSPTESVLVEDYIPYDAVIIHYTMNKGKCYFSGMSDKYSVKFESTGASVMGLQLFPSRGIEQYLITMDSIVKNMFEKEGFTDGPIWIEAFYDGKEKFVFNEMGYRFGGSLTNYPVEYFYQIDQVEQMIRTSLCESFTIPNVKVNNTKKYCILPVHIKAGTIACISGLDNVNRRNDVYAYVPVHFEGDEIQEWGSAQQVFCYLHILYENFNTLHESICQILNILSANDDKGENLLFPLFDINLLKNADFQKKYQ